MHDQVRAGGAQVAGGHTDLAAVGQLHLKLVLEHHHVPLALLERHVRLQRLGQAVQDGAEGRDRVVREQAQPTHAHEDALAVFAGEMSALRHRLAQRPAMPVPCAAPDTHALPY